MPRIPSTPTVRTFTETWSADFKEAVTRAAGKNGKLSLAEAKKLATSTSPDKMFADTAIALLKLTGKAETVDALATSAKAYAQRAAQVAAGPDGKLSLADGQKLSKDLVEDFFMLRGKPVPAEPTTPVTPPVTPPSSPPLTTAQLQAKLELAVDGLWMPSESDARLKFVSGGPLNGAAITPALLRERLGAQHDALWPQVMGGGPTLAGRTRVETRSAGALLSKLSKSMDPGEPRADASAARFAALKTELLANLTDLTVVRFGSRNISTFIVGRTKTGELAGLLTGQVET